MKFTLHAFILAFLLVFMHPAFNSSARAANADEQSLVSIGNFAQVSSTVYRGGRPTGPDQFRELRKLGIKTVINLQGGDIGNSTFGWIAGILEPGEAPSWISYEKKEIEALGMKFLNVPINSLDSIDPKQGYGLGRAIALMNNAANQPVYVHCEHGIDRTGLLIALYRVHYQNWRRQEAYDEMVAMGHSAFRQFFTGDMSAFFWAATEDKP